MRVLILSQFFDPEPILKGVAFARGLEANGFEVEVLTGFPNYPGGKVYEGHRIRPWKREVIDGIRVTRVALYPSHDRSALRRVFNYVSFALMASVFGPFLIRRPDVVYVYHPPPTTGIPALLIRWLRGAPFVYEIQDLWPDTLGATGMLNRPRLLRLIGDWCLRMYRAANHVVVISPGLRRILVERGVPPERVTVLYNWCDEHRMQPSPRNPALAAELGLESGTFTVMFAGTMGLAQGLDALLEVAALSQTALPRVRYVFVGSGVDRDRLRTTAAARGLDNVLFLERQPMERMGSILSLADALIVHLKDDPLFAVTVPSKTQAYLYAGIPVIMAVRGDGSDLIARSEGGVTCDPDDPAAILAAVRALTQLSVEDRQAMGRRGREFYDRELSVATGCRQYAHLLRAVVANNANSAR